MHFSNTAVTAPPLLFFNLREPPELFYFIMSDNRGHQTGNRLSVTCLSGLSRWGGALGAAVVCWGLRDCVPPHGLYLMAEQGHSHGWGHAARRCTAPQSRALGARHVLWAFNCVAGLLSPSLSNYGMICFWILRSGLSFDGLCKNCQEGFLPNNS